MKNFMSEKRVAFLCYKLAMAYASSTLAVPYIGTFHVLVPAACTASPISLSPFCVCCVFLYKGEEVSWKIAYGNTIHTMIL